MKCKIHFKTRSKITIFLPLFIFSGYEIFMVISKAPLLQIFIYLMFIIFFGIAAYGAFSWRFRIENDIVTISAFGAKAIDIPIQNILFVRPKEKLDYIRFGHGPKNQKTVIGYFYEEKFQKYGDLICFGFNNKDYNDFIKNVLEKNPDIQVTQPENSI